jgi:hypothetical protein
MLAKTGVARLALATGAPVIPVAHWGTYDILPYGDKKPKLFPRKTVRTVAGKPIDLSQWAGKHTSAKAQREATDKIMGQVTALLADLRGETPPALPYDPAQEREPRGAAVSGLTSEERSDERGGNSPREERPEASAENEASAGNQ